MVASQGSSLDGRFFSNAQIVNVPLAPDFPQTLIQMLAPGVNPFLSIMGIFPAPSLSSHSIRVKAPQAAPLYIAIPPSVSVPATVEKFTYPDAGTVILDQTSLYVDTQQPGSAMPVETEASTLVPAV